MKIQIPQISIDLDTTKPASEVTLLSVGLGLHQGWTYSTMYGGKNVFGIGEASTLHGYTWFFYTSVIAFALFLILFGLTDQHMRKKLINKTGLLLGAGCMFAGTALACVCGYLDGQALILTSIAAGVISGFGSALVFIFWGIAMSLLDYQSIVLNASLSILIIAVIYALVLQIVPRPIGGIITCILPLLEAVLLMSIKPSFFHGETRVPVSTPLPIRRFAFAWHLILPLAFFGMAAGLIKGNAIMKPMESASLNTIPILLAAGFAFIYVTGVLSTAAKNTTDVQTFKRVIPLVAVGTVCIPFMNAYDTIPLLDVIVIASFFTFEIFFFIFLNTLSQGYRLSPVYIYGLGRGTLAIAALIGSVITASSTEIVKYTPWGDTDGALLILLFLVLGFCALPSRATIEKAALNTCSLTFYYKRGTENAGLSGLKSTELANSDSPLPPVKTAASQPTAASTAADATEGVRQASGTIDDPIPQQELLQAQCEAIANCYLLSQRETEVFYYLAKGYNSARIQEVLYISEGTAKTHIRHIYRKLNIHSQQELIRMVDETLE